jgi:Flp pilus assembly protein TadD
MSKESRARGAINPIDRPLSSPEPSRFLVRWGTLLAGSIIVLATLAAYHNSFSAPFIFDDEPGIRDNFTIRHLWQSLTPPHETQRDSGLPVAGRPAVNFSLAINYTFGGLAVQGYHVLSLAIHIFAGLVLFGAVRRTLQLPPLRERFGDAAWWLALAVAALWTLHPLQTESVTYISQRAESLMGLFYLLTLYCFIRGTESNSQLWLLGSILSCTLGMASKEVMISAPLIVLLYDRTFMAETFREAWGKRWRLYAGLGGTWLLLGYLVAGTHGRGNSAGFGTDVNWWSYALTQFRAIIHYLRLSFWPDPLVFDYGTTLATRPAEIVPYAVIVLLLVMGTAIALWRRPAVGFLGAWFFAILAPTSSVVPVATQTMAEHRMYLALVPMAVLGVLGLYSLLGRRSAVIFLALAAGLGWVTAQRNETYCSAVAIWGDTVAKCPGNTRAHLDYGNALQKIPGHTDEAISEYQAVLKLQPNHDAVKAYDNLGALLLQKGDISAAIADFNAALQIGPNYAEAHNDLGRALRQEGNIDGAITEYETALQIRPSFAEAHNNLGSALSAIPGQMSAEISEFETALKLDPDLAVAHYNLANVLGQEGRYPDACEQYNEALKSDPDYYQAHANLGAALFRMGRLSDAIIQFKAALQMKPDDPTIRRNLERVQNILLETQGKN